MSGWVPDEDLAMRNFLYLKALIARYGVDRASNIMVLASRLVEADRRLFPNKRKAIEFIEETMGNRPTTPISEEAATYTTYLGREQNDASSPLRRDDPHPPGVA